MFSCDLIFILFLFSFFAFLSSQDTQPQPQQTVTTLEKPEKPDENGKSGQTGNKPVHKWPIRPGVHVHVNGLHTLGGASTGAGGSAPVPDISGFSYGAKNTGSGSDSASNTSQHDTGNPVSETDGGSSDHPLPDETDSSKPAKGTSTESPVKENHDSDISSQNNNNDNATSQPLSATPPPVSAKSSQVFKGIKNVPFRILEIITVTIRFRARFERRNESVEIIVPKLYIPYIHPARFPSPSFSALSFLAFLTFRRSRFDAMDQLVPFPDKPGIRTVKLYSSIN